MIIAFIGDIGSGKTLSMVRFMHEKHLKGFSVFTNFKLMFENMKMVNYLNSKFFQDYSKSGLELLNSVVAIDEAHVFFDSRNAMLKRNKIFSKFITQSRKRSVDLIYTTQDKSPELFLSSGQVELRLRKLTDYIIYCQSCNKAGKKIIINNYCDKYGKVMKKKIFIGNPYFKRYDTNEIIDFEDY